MAELTAEAAARLLSGSVFNAALWVAASAALKEVMPKAVNAFRLLASGLLQNSGFSLAS